MLEVLGPMMAVWLVFLGLAVPFIIYVIARWRAHRDTIHDGQLGLKVALGYFQVIAFHVLLAGVTLLFYAVLSSSSTEEKSQLYRFAFGLMVPGGIVLASHVALLGRTNQLVFPNVRRLILGYNLLITGTLGFFGLVMAFQALFGKGSAGDLGRIAGSMVLVYGSAWAAVGVQFGRLAFGEGGTSAPPPMSTGSGTTSTGAPSASAPQTPSGPQLPSLGGGAYPPIQK